MRTTWVGMMVFLLADASGALAQAEPAPAIPAQATTEPVLIIMDAGPAEVMGGEPECGSCCCEEPPCRPLRLNAQYLLWCIKDGPLPVPLATSDRNNDITNPTAAGLADPNTIVLLGGAPIEFGMASGFRGFLGMDLNDDWSAEAGGFFLASQLESYFLNSLTVGRPIIFRPFVGLRENLSPFIFPNAGKFVSSTNDDIGSLTVDCHSSLWGLEANLIRHWLRGDRYRLDVLVGFRNVNLSEDVDVTDLSTLVEGGTGFFLGEVFPTPQFIGDQFNIFERIAAYNHFYGGQVGLRGEVRRGRWGLLGGYKLALGGNCQTIKQDATSVHVTASTGEVDTAPGGLLVQPFNIGSRTHSEFSFINEIEVTLNYHLDGLRLFLGYDLLCWSNVIRPGNQIDLFINDTTAPITRPDVFSPTLIGPPVPRTTFRQSDFWAQGLHLGFELSF